MQKLLFFLSTFTLIGSIKSMETNQKKVELTTFFAIPGQNGMGSETRYVQKLLGANALEIINVPTPNRVPDLGQNQCIKYLRNEIQNHNGTENIVIHATSQGTATALNCLAHEDKGKKIKGLILEAVCISGNSAIEHTLQGPLMNASFLTRLPLSYYWIPYAAKALFPFYWPAGKQAIKSIPSIPTHVPVIIVHSKNDMQLSHDGALALYYGLKKNGNEAYLISKEGSNHVNLLQSIEEKSLFKPY